MDTKIHILALPLPLQGHMNPMLQFCKRLVMASQGTVRVTLVTTNSANISVPEEEIDSIEVDFIADVTEEIFAGSDPVDVFMEKFKVTVTKKLGNFIEKKNIDSGYPIKLVLYDSLIPWALTFLKVDLGFPVAAFFTQACFVSAIYNHIHRGTFRIPLESENYYLSLPSMPPLESGDLPSPVYDSIAYPCALDIVLGQNLSLEKADWLLFNTFDMLENEVCNFMSIYIYIYLFLKNLSYLYICGPM